MFHPYFEQLADWATADRFQHEVEAARRQYFAGVGPIHEEDRSFEIRMAVLSEFYLLDRPLETDAAGRTPARLYLDEHHAALDSEAQEALLGLSRSHPSLFEVRKLGEEKVVLRDLLLHEDHTVHERRKLPGVEKGDLVQTRIIPWRDGLVLSRAVLYHPREVRKLVLKACKDRRKSGELDTVEERLSFLAALSRRALQVERQQANNRTPPPVERVYDGI